MKKITDRLIERARLGELTDEEYQEFVAELRDRGELHRLEDAISRHEEFLNEYPPHIMATRIRSRLINSEVAEPDTPSRVRYRAPALGFAAVLLVAGALAVYTSLDDGSATDTSRADTTLPSDTTPDDERPGSGMKPSTTQTRPAERRVEDVLSDLVCTKGDRFSFPSAPIEAMSVSPPGPVKAYATDDGETLVIECLELGSAVVDIPRKTTQNDQPVNFNEKIRVDVARHLDATELASIEERLPELDRCKTEQELPEWFRNAKLTIHWSAIGKVRNVETRGSSSPGPVLDCLTGVVDGWQLPQVPREVPLREYTLEWKNERGPEAFVEDIDARNLDRPGRERAVTKAQGSLIRGDTSQAIRSCESFLATNPPTGVEKCHRVLGVAYRQQGNSKKSCHHFNLAGTVPASCEGVEAIDTH